MDKLIEKLSSYHIFNFIIPGAVYCLLCQKLYGITLRNDHIIQDVVLFYFIGLIISRIGSLLIEPFLKKVCSQNYCSYNDYIDGSQEDSKIELLSEVNNTFRTMIALGIVSLVTDIIVRFSSKFSFISAYYSIIIAVLFVALFTASYIKQTKMVSQRVNRAVEKKNEQRVKETTSTIITRP